MLPVGGVLPQHIFRTVKLFHGVSPYDFMIFVLEGVVWLFVLYFVVTELRKFRCCCFKKVTTILSLGTILLSLSLFALLRLN